MVPQNVQIKSSALNSLLLKIKQRQLENQLTQCNQGQTGSPNLEITKPIFQASDGIIYNEEQLAFINLATSGKNCVLIGAAGTGKTTCQKGAVSSLIQSGNIPTIQNNLDHKYLKNGTPGIVLTSFTRRAVRNLKKALPKDLESNCITIHKLLEYAPTYYEVYDEASDSYKNQMRFEPTRGKENKLPKEIKCIIFDESSMISVELYNQVIAAVHPFTQVIFVGDIQQLPPVFGSAILGFKLLELPVIELTQVYRQALESPIIKLATQIRNGEVAYPSLKEKLVEETEKGTVTLHPWKKKLSSDNALQVAAKFTTVAIDSGFYDPSEDQILIPFNKAFGTIELNKHIANHLAKKEGKPVYEIISGYNKLYFSVGDLVLYDKDDAVITKISRNPNYLGKSPQKESPSLDYWGYNSESNGMISFESSEEMSEDEIDAYLDRMSEQVDSEDRVTQASHTITVQMLDSETKIDLSSASELNSLLHSYALTVHKAQGSEYDKVFVFLHQSHNTMIQRELLYTAITRAKTHLYVICEPDHFKKGIESQRIKGNSLAEKAEYFKGKLDSKM